FKNDSTEFKAFEMDIPSMHLIELPVPVPGNDSFNPQKVTWSFDDAE
ncbi:unnamed protein product, partial [marine sediment metagenome]